MLSREIIAVCSEKRKEATVSALWTECTVLHTVRVGLTSEV